MKKITLLNDGSLPYLGVLGAKKHEDELNDFKGRIS